MAKKTTKRSTKKKAGKSVKKSNVNSEVAFLKFLKSHKDLSRTAVYNSFRKSGGKIRKQRALDISRAFVSAKKGEFTRKTISETVVITDEEIRQETRTKRKPLIHKESKPRKGYSNVLNKKGEFITKTAATELRRMQRKLRIDKGIKVSLKELSLAKTADFFAGKSETAFAYSLRGEMEILDLAGPRSITIIDRNGVKHTFYGTYEDLYENNAKFISVVDGEQQRLFSGAENALNARGFERDKDKESPAYKVFQMSVEVQNFRDENGDITAQVIDYRDISTIEESPIDAEEIMTGRKKVRK